MERRCAREGSGQARLRAASAALSTVLLLACAGPGARSDLNRTTGPTPGTAAAALPVLHREDTLWLERVTFGLDSASVAEYRRLGRERFLERQLRAGDAALPAPIAAQIAALEVSHADPAHWLAEVNAQIQDHQCHARRRGQGTGAQDAQRPWQQARLRGHAPRAAARGVFARRSCRNRWSGSGSTISACTSTRPICAGWSATTRSARSGRMRSGISRIWCWRRSNIRRCCSIWTTIRMPPGISTRTTRASSWSCTRSA